MFFREVEEWEFRVDTGEPKDVSATASAVIQVTVRRSSIHLKKLQEEGSSGRTTKGFN